MAAHSRVFLQSFSKFITPFLPFTRTLQSIQYKPLFEVLSSRRKILARNATTSSNQKETLQRCPISRRNIKFTYKDVLLLAQFISPEGNILNRRITGVCRKQQRKLEKAIEISRRAGKLVMSYPKKASCLDV
ncbi:28S ribosomal protein S18a, mitochondrial-like isoform X2 [Xenia sp. Carnegie-2017]|uniref:28S ribosomal protein S18a, mitochondrial-like isoform X2 n=1 Tax=Xenia sp. Carnegie-2017 TaxID=2897299 RepID=UPI001F04591D|nr:28S ribosomal protein S18a, mitochondrial-like isoform X2 [Xenia sp. Carnegie-2017]